MEGEAHRYDQVDRGDQTPEEDCEQYRDGCRTRGTTAARSLVDACSMSYAVASRPTKPPADAPDLAAALAVVVRNARKPRRQRIRINSAPVIRGAGGMVDLLAVTSPPAASSRL
jgi:hypothetical protein